MAARLAPSSCSARILSIGRPLTSASSCVEKKCWMNATGSAGAEPASCSPTSSFTSSSAPPDRTRYWRKSASLSESSFFFWTAASCSWKPGSSIAVDLRRLCSSDLRKAKPFLG